jgi:hypothetical protein
MMTCINTIPNQQICAFVGSKIEPDKDDSTLIGKVAPEAKVINGNGTSNQKS